MNISAELSEISSYGGLFALTVGGDAAGWHPVTQSYTDGFADLIAATCRRYHTTEVRIAVGTSPVSSRVVPTQAGCCRSPAASGR